MAHQRKISDSLYYTPLLAAVLPLTAASIDPESGLAAYGGSTVFNALDAGSAIARPFTNECRRLRHRPHHHGGNQDKPRRMQ